VLPTVPSLNAREIKILIAAAIYTSEKVGSDETGLGTEDKPFKTILQAMRHAGVEPFPAIYVDGKEEAKFAPASKSQLKKIQKIWLRESHKQADAAKKEEQDAAKREKNLEEAKKVIVTEDKSLPTAKRIKISQGRIAFFTRKLDFHCRL
jgi:asparaginyl-tRNA synthetase